MTRCELHGWDRSPTCRYRERQARGEEDFEDITRMMQPTRVEALRDLGVAVVQVREDGSRVREDGCPFCGKTESHRSAPGDKFHHVYMPVDGPWPQ
jgi:hypothetical protein